MAAADAKPFPLKNTAYRVTFPILDNDGDLVTGAAGLDSEVSIDGGTFADCTNEATEIATSSGMYYLDLTAAEMNGDTIAIIVKTTTTDAKTTPMVLYPVEAGDIQVNVTQWNSAAVATPTVAGVPEVDITHISGDGQSATDLKDFADAGYDPATNKVEGVKTADALTANNDKTGYSISGTKQTLDALNDLAQSDVLSDATPFAGGNVDASISSRSSHAAADVWSVGTRSLTDKAGFSLSAAGIQAIWDILTSNLTTVGSIGKLLVDNINAQISSRSSHAAADIWSVGTRSLTDKAGFTISGTKQTLDALNDVSEAQVKTQADQALVDIHLDHLLAVDTPAPLPGVAGAILQDLLEDDGGAWRYNANALEQAPSGGTNPNVLVSTTIATVTSQTVFTLTAGSNDDDAYKDQSIVLYDADDSDYPSVRKVSSYVGATKTVTIDTAPDFTIVVGDGVKAFVTAPGTTAPTAAQNADAVWDEAIADHTTGTTFGGKNQKVVPSETLADYKADVSALALASVCTETRLAELDAANIPTDLTNIEDDTQDLQTQVGTDGAGLTAVPWNAAWDAQVESECTDALNAYDPPTRAELTTDKNSIITEIDANETKIDSAQTDITAIKAKTDSLTFTTANKVDSRVDYVGTNAVTTPDDFKADVSNLDTTVSSRAAESGGNVATILADTNELQTDWVNGGRLDLIIDAILADTNELQGDLTDGGRLDLLIDAIKAKTDALPSGIAKNVALSNFEFYMVLSSDHVTAATGKTVTGQISKDGGAFAGLTNAIAEISNGMYKVDITQTEMNADVITLKFTETDCDQRTITIYTT